MIWIPMTPLRQEITQVWCFQDQIGSKSMTRQSPVPITLLCYPISLISRTCLVQWGGVEWTCRASPSADRAIASASPGAMPHVCLCLRRPTDPAGALLTNAVRALALRPRLSFGTMLRLWFGFLVLSSMPVVHKNGGGGWGIAWPSRTRHAGLSNEANGESSP